MADDQSIAAQWKSFDLEKRTRLLAKMTPDQKRNLRRAIEGGIRPDFTTNPKGEGTYRMQQTGGDFIGVPYSNVMQASQAGYKIHPDDRGTYTRDRTAEILKQHPKHWRSQGLQFPEYTSDLSDKEALAQLQVPEAAPIKPGALSQVGQEMGSTWDTAKAKVQAWTEPTVTPSSAVMSDAAGEMGLNTAKRVGRVLFGIPDMGVEAFGALKDAFSSDPQTAYQGGQRFIAMVNPTEQVWNRVLELRDDWRRDPKLAASNVAGDVIGMWLAGKAGEIAGAPVKSVKGASQALTEKASQALKLPERFGPRTVNVAGVEIPVAVGEAAPVSPAGRYQIELKRRGVGAKHFERLEREQQAQVKRAIRRVANLTTSGSLPTYSLEEPGVAMSNAADAAHAQARPMYDALDGAVRTLPASFERMTPIVKQAIARARKLGVNIDPAIEEPMSVVFDGAKITQAQFPQLWQQLIDQGIINPSGEGTPLSAVQKVRSQLLKMRRSSSDAAVRYAIGDEVKVIDKQMERALKGTPLYDDWREADRLWSKGYALRDVADAIRRSTKGTPMREQAPGLSRVPPRLQAASLVNRLNTLADEGVLKKAFTAEQIKNLRQSADVLDRIQRTHVGTERGESISHSRAMGQAVSGRMVPKWAGIAGGVIGGLTHGPWGAVEGAGIGAILGHFVQMYGDAKLAEIMTKAEFVPTLEALEKAKTAAQRQAAMKKLATLAAASSASTASLRELKAEAKKRQPAGSTAPVAAAQ